MNLKLKKFYIFNRNHFDYKSLPLHSHLKPHKSRHRNNKVPLQAIEWLIYKEKIEMESLKYINEAKAKRETLVSDEIFQRRFQ